MLGLGNEVRGFDTEQDLVDPKEHLEMYRKFLGEDEYDQTQ